MKIYQYHPETKELLNVSIAPKNPLESDKYLIPAYATTEIPPETKRGEIPIYENGWKVEEDHREEVFYDKEGNEVIIEEIGDIPENLLKEKPKERKRKNDTTKKLQEALARLDRIDFLSIRPLRAKIAGKATKKDEQILEDLEKEAKKLRKDLKKLDKE